MGKRSHFHQFHYPLRPWDQNRPASWHCQGSRSGSVVRRLRCCSSLPQGYLDLRMHLYILYTSLIHAHTLWSPARYLNNHIGHTDTNKFLDSGLSSHNMSQQTCYSASATFQKTTKAVAFAAFSLDRTFKIWVNRKKIFPRWHSSVSAHFHQTTQQNTITCLRADVTKDLGRNGDCVWTLRLRIHCKLQGFLHSFLATSKTKWNGVYHHPSKVLSSNLEHWESILMAYISNRIFTPP